MSLYPKVPTTTKHTDTHTTNIDRLMNSKNVKPEDLANLKKWHSGDAKKEYRTKTLNMMMKITYNSIRANDLQAPNTASIGDRISFAMAVKAVENLIYARMTDDYDYYGDQTVVDRLTMEKCEEKLLILKSHKLWQNKKELNEYFKWHKKNVEPTTKPMDDV